MDQYGILTFATKNDQALISILFPNEICYSVYGSCDGLVLFNVCLELRLMNPITQKKVAIPNQLRRYRAGYGIRVSEEEYGFGYDSCSHDYKIVKLTSSYLPQYSDDNLAMTVVDVYSVKKCVWKKLDDGCYPYGGYIPVRYAFDSGALVNGALHWLIGTKDGYRSCIAAFDLANEVFSDIPLPQEFVRKLGYEADNSTSMNRDNGLSVVGGCLLIVENFGNGTTDVWIMKEYGVAKSWVKFCIVAEGANWHRILATLCFVGDGKLLCITATLDYVFLFVCDLEGGTMKKVDLGGRSNKFFHGMAFVDSLVSPEGSP